MIIGILQARFSSTRLPGKVLLPILGVPMILRQIERLHRSARLQALVLATSDDPTDDVLADTVAQAGVQVVRGSLDDVLDRFMQAAIASNASTIVRLTGDCPLADPFLIDQLIDFHQHRQADYSSLSLRPTFPDGLDAEVFGIKALCETHAHATLPSEREHVTPYLYKNPERFKIASFEHSRDLSGLRWTVDQAEDFALVRTVYERLYAKNPTFSWLDVLALIEAEPALAALNGGILRNEGYVRSQARDTERPG